MNRSCELFPLVTVTGRMGWQLGVVVAMQIWKCKTEGVQLSQ